MWTRNDLIDLLMERLGKSASGSQAEAPPRRSEPKGRLFLSEYDIKRRLTPQSKRLTIPKDAIVSPLAAEWLALNGIVIVRE